MFWLLSYFIDQIKDISLYDGPHLLRSDSSFSVRFLYREVSQEHKYRVIAEQTVHRRSEPRSHYDWKIGWGTFIRESSGFWLILKVTSTITDGKQIAYCVNVSSFFLSYAGFSNSLYTGWHYAMTRKWWFWRNMHQNSRILIWGTVSTSAE